MRVFDLELLDTHYYIKRRTIVEKITFNNRTFYSKFKRIDEPLTPIVLTQHFNHEYTIAVPLLYHNTTNYLVLEYQGEAFKRFIHLVKHLFKSLQIENYSIYQGKEIEHIQVYIRVKALCLEEADKQLNTISHSLESKMTKNWKYLPTLSLPKAYNILTLPYKKI